MPQQHAQRDVRAVGVADCNDVFSGELVRCHRLEHELAEGVRSREHVFDVDVGHRSTGEESVRDAVFEHQTTRTEQRRLRHELLTERHEIMFITACSVQQQERPRAGATPEHMLVTCQRWL